MAEASSFRNIKHKFPTIFGNREHSRCQGYAPFLLSNIIADLWDLQTCLQSSVAEASNFRNIKHKFSNKFCERDHLRCQGYAPLIPSFFLFYKDVRATLLFCCQILLQIYWTCKLVCNLVWLKLPASEISHF